jgi:hypothetical protein
MQKVEQAEIDRRALRELHAVDVDGLARGARAGRGDLVHDEITRAVHQHHERSETLLHGVLGDGLPDLRRAIVMASVL